MKKVKFRAWDTEEKKWFPEHHGGQWINITSLGNIVFGFEDGDPENGDGRFEIQLYTGLKDKNGKEIYEGDVLCRNFQYGEPETAEVYFNEKTAGFNVKLPQNSGWNPILGVYYNAFDNGVEVIGNIYETPARSER